MTVTLIEIIRALVDGDGGKLRDAVWQKLAHEALDRLANDVTIGGNSPASAPEPDAETAAPPGYVPAADVTALLDELAALREEIRALREGAPR